jgi:hypothetical protein
MIPDVIAVRATLAAGDGSAPGLLGPEGAGMIAQMGGVWSWWALPGLALAAAGIAIAARDPRRRTAVALALIGLPLFVAMTATLGTWTYARFALFSIPGAILLKTITLDLFLDRVRLLGVAAGATLLAVFAADLVTRPPKQPLRDAVDLVRAGRDPDDRLLVIGLQHRVISVYADDLPHATSLAHGADLDRWLTDPPRWIIALYPRHIPAERMQRLER